MCDPLGNINICKKKRILKPFWLLLRYFSLDQRLTDKLTIPSLEPLRFGSSPSLKWVSPSNHCPVCKMCIKLWCGGMLSETGWREWESGGMGGLMNKYGLVVLDNSHLLFSKSHIPIYDYYFLNQTKVCFKWPRGCLSHYIENMRPSRE